MPKVSFLKLFDEAILPAFIIFGAKIGGYLVANKLFDLNWIFDFSKFDLASPFILYLDASSARVATDTSVLIVFSVLAICFGWVIFRTHHLHLSHLHPVKAKKLVLENKEVLLSDTNELYHQAAVWLSLTSYLYLETIFLFFLDRTSLFIFSLATSLYIGLVLLLLLDVKREISLIRSAGRNK